VLAFLEWHAGWWGNQQMLHEGLASKLAYDKPPALPSIVYSTVQMS